MYEVVRWWGGGGGDGLGCEMVSRFMSLALYPHYSWWSGMSGSMVLVVLVTVVAAVVVALGMYQPDNWRTMAENATSASDSISVPSKYSIGAASRQGRLNKEASQMRGRVQQLLEAVAAQQQKHGRKSSSDTATNAVSNNSGSNNNSSTSSSTAAGMAALFVRRNLGGVASLFSSTTTVALNARHLRMNRQLTKSQRLGGAHSMGAVVVIGGQDSFSMSSNWTTTSFSAFSFSNATR
ncbi:hypothetical protein TcWFU_004794 [Taenia crassiceps]|uniref:Uncharacterized protein n=1 Tax=Taenia crassiceps TaxID=6207 RepID=A0ABR4Q3V7_9CEST